MNRGMLASLAWLAIALAGAVPARGANTTAAEVEEDNSLASRLVTPHKAWGRGYAGGRVRALFLVHAGHSSGEWNDPGTRLREVVELVQRFDLDAEAILFAGSGNTWEFHGQTLGETRAARLLAKPYQLYVVAGFPMEKLPARMQFLIIEQVAKGAGLVCCGPGAPEFMALRRQIQPLPAMLAEALPRLEGKNPAETITAYRMGKGRGVWLNYGAQSLTPYHEFTFRRLAEYDYWMLLVGRSALWAASRDAEVSLAAAGPLRVPSAKTNGVPLPNSGEIALVLQSPQPLAVRVELELRRACDGWTKGLATIQTALAPGQTARLPVAIPRLRAGDHFLDAVVRSQRGVETFGAASFIVQADFGVEKVEVSKPFVERGEPIATKMVVRGAPPAGSVLQVRLRDSYDRVLRQHEFPVKAGQTEYRFEYRPDAAATVLMRVEAAVLCAGEEVEMKDASFTVPKRRHGQFNFVQWDAPHDVLGYHAWRRLQGAGMGVSLIPSMGGLRAQPPVLRACDASVACYSTRILDEKDANGQMKPVCWNHDPAAAGHVQGIVDNQRLLRQQGVFVYSLGDEGVTLGCCVHPACLAAYRSYLAAQYGTIDKLNASWGGKYKSFDEVDLLDRKDNMESAAAKTSPARAFDRQAFARVNLSRFAGRFVGAYRRLDPQAVTGYEGTGGFGDDYDAILGTNTFYGPYPSIGDDLVRSTAPRTLIRSNWIGYSKTSDALSDAAWRAVMKGVDSVWFWMWDGMGSFRGYLSPTLDFWPATAELTEEMRPVRQGLGDLLLRSTMSHAGIAVFYSVPSAICEPLHPGSEFIAPQAAHEAWTGLTYELGLDFRYITSAMLKRGMLDPREFKVLLLPMSQAIGPDEAEAIRRFVHSGGTAIADVRPGIYDAHGKPVAPGPLDDLFGIRRTGRGKAVLSSVTIKTALEGHALDVHFDQAGMDPDVQAATAQALAKTGVRPLILINRVGSGRAILLNFQVPLPTGKEPDVKAVAGRRLLSWLYRIAGAKAAVSVASPSGDPLPLVETRVWKNGDSLVVGLYRRMQCEWFAPKTGMSAGEPVAAKMKLPAARQVYDLRAGKHLGNVAEVDARLRWGRANFYLVADREIPPPQLALSAAAPTPGQPITATIRLDAPSGVSNRHAIWVEIIDPQGQSLLWGQQVVMLERGAGQLQIPIAYNDRSGRWRIQATELFSRRSVEASWSIP